MASPRLYIAQPPRGGQRRRMAHPRRPGRGLPAGRAVRLGRPRLHAHQRARAGQRQRVPDQSLRPDVRGDHRVEPGQGRHRGQQARRLAVRRSIRPASRSTARCTRARHDASACCTRTRSTASRCRRRRAACCRCRSSRSSCWLSLGYHDYEGVALRDDEKPRLVADLGDKTFLMLRNHGLLTVGATIADAFLACTCSRPSARSRCARMAGGGELVADRPGDHRARAAQQAAQVTRGIGAGALTWPGLLRRLDRAARRVTTAERGGAPPRPRHAALVAERADFGAMARVPAVQGGRPSMLLHVRVFRTTSSYSSMRRLVPAAIVG